MGTNPLTWQIAAASVCGISHQRQGLPCQDAHAWEVLPSGTIVIAVADGAGSAMHSDRGSLIAVQAAIASLRDQADDWFAELNQHDQRLHQATTQYRPAPSVAITPDPELECGDPLPPLQASPLHHRADPLLTQVLHALTLEAARENWKLADLATTLVLVIANDRAAIAVQIGDGVAIVNYGDSTDPAGEQTIALTIPRNGEYANETTFVTSQTAHETLQIATWSGALRHLAVMTDGLQRLALSFPQAVPHQPFFRPLFQFVAQHTDTALAGSQLAHFLASPRVTDRADDDLTLFLACLTDQSDSSDSSDSGE